MEGVALSAIGGLETDMSPSEVYRLIQALTTVKDSFNSYPLDRVALAGAQAAIEDEA